MMRIMKKGAVCAVTVTLATALAGCGGGDDEDQGKQPAASSSMKAAATPSAETSSSAQESAPAPDAAASDSQAPEQDGASDAKEFGPQGYGELKLGMRPSELAGLSQLVKVTAQPGKGPSECGTFAWLDDTSKIGGYISGQQGVSSVFAKPGWKTREGIAVGSSTTAVKAAYPKLKEGPNYSSAEVPQNDSAEYGFLFAGGKVKELLISTPDQDCHN
ncbi:hypothetical protein ACFVQ0_15745 [Streptomyces sp. NPDC057900]|uniref:hypothetical protein n=1 Tax=Streptomyces sp. NPDC057900 TaxID=3346274 RepID=UPI0036E98C4B